MNFKILATALIFAASGNAFAACDLRANLVDTRDDGLSFDPLQTVVYLSPDGGLGDCKLLIRATGLPNPRSSVFRNYRITTLNPNFFSRMFIVSDALLQGDGAITFAKMKFGKSFNGVTSVGGNYYLLSLFILPGTQPAAKGQNSSPTYRISGTLDTMSQAGGILETRPAFHSRELIVGAEGGFQIDWNSGNRPDPYSWAMVKTLDIYFDSSGMQRIISFDQIDSEFTGEFDFYPNSETVGDLRESAGLQKDQLKFKLGGYIVF